jgi:hypothetical protein
MIATSPVRSCTVSLSVTTHASPRTVATTVNGASSSMRSDQGGSIEDCSRNASRARGPSSRPAMESITRR